jgi:adenosylhomocysteine nucleosidase
VKVCDVVISTDVSHHDVDERQLKNCYPNEQFFIADEKLLNVAKNVSKTIIGNGNNHHIGRIVSGENFIDDTSKKEDIINRLAPYCVEMEASAIGHVSHINKIPFLIIRSISDNANEEAEISYETFEKKAAYQSANLLLDIIKEI